MKKKCGNKHIPTLNSETNRREIEQQQNFGVTKNLTCPVTGEHLLCHGKFFSFLLEGNDRMKDSGSREPSFGQLLTCYSKRRQKNAASL